MFDGPFGFGGVNPLSILFVGFSILFWIALIGVLVLLVRFLLIGTKAAQVYLQQHDTRPRPVAHQGSSGVSTPPPPPAGPPAPSAGPQGQSAPHSSSHAAASSTVVAGPGPTAAAAQNPQTRGSAPTLPSPPAGAAPASAAPAATAPASAPASAAAAPPAQPAAARPAPADAPTVVMTPVSAEDAAPHEAPTVPLQSGAVPLDQKSGTTPRRAPRTRKSEQ